MFEYLIQWAHMYIVHFGIWVTFMFGITMHSNGIPHLKELPDMFKTSMILSAILSIFSSHSHHHFMTHLAGK